jgi:uncharacterized protein
MKNWQKKLIKIANPALKKIGPEHDIDHAKRVFSYCLIFSRGYEAIDTETLFAAAYLHDLGYSKNKRGVNHSQLILDEVVSILKKAQVPENKFDLIKKIVRFHGAREDLSKMKLPIEISIFHDADKMDGVGALGVARQFVYAGRVNKKMWDPKIKRNSSLPYGGDFSAIHTLLDYHLTHRFYTKRARKMAEGRKKFMQSYIKKFIQEWNLKNDSRGR